MSMLLDLSSIIAQAQPQAPGPFTTFGPLIFLAAFFYLFAIRPQRKREKAHQEAITKLKKGDQVMIESSIYGEIESVENDAFMVKLADKMIIKVHSRGIRAILKNGDVASEAATTK